MYGGLVRNMLLRGEPGALVVPVKVQRFKWK